MKRMDVWLGVLVVVTSTDFTSGLRFDGIGGLSGGGATSTFLEAYDPQVRDEILDWMFKPGFAASLGILKVEIGADDQTTDGCESCHMRSPTDLNCNRGYEWALMKQAVQRNPNITLYGLPWGFAAWLGFGTTNPYHNVTATADYTAKWVECGRDTHGLNISVLGLWNEAWAASGRPDTDPWEYALALRSRLDSAGLAHVRIIVPDGNINDILRPLQANASYLAATWGLGQHYPGAGGTSADERALGKPLWSSEDYSTYSDATGAGCFARLLVQNVGWGYSATISWYLLGAFARGMDYDADGLIRAEWPTSGHWEVTPMAWVTMHWTLFTDVGWDITPCGSTTARCSLPGGGNYALLTSPTEATLVVETFLHSASKCVRNDPPDWHVQQTQVVVLDFPAQQAPAGTKLEVWRSCSGWRYPANDDTWMQRGTSVTVASNNTITFTADVNCYYTVTTLTGRVKPMLPAGGVSNRGARPAAFPLPYRENFEGITVGAEAPFFGDQEAKWETVPAGGGRTGHASQQQLTSWPILEPQCNVHSQPISIIGDLFFESVRITTDVLIESEGTGVGVALRVRNPGSFFRGVAPGLFLYIGATPGVDGKNAGGVVPPASMLLPGWILCADSYCNEQITNGSLPEGSSTAVGHWHTLQLEVSDNQATGAIDTHTVFKNVVVSQSRASSEPIIEECVAHTTVVTNKVIAGYDYRQTTLNSTGAAAIASCVRDCCADIVCKAWAVTLGSEGGQTSNAGATCWLKTGGTMDERSGQLACGFKVEPPATTVPPSGWAAVVATLGVSQFDNFALDGTGPGGASAEPCTSAPPLAGAMLSSTPCDYPGADTIFAAGTSGGHLVLSTTTTLEGGPLCIGSNNSINATLVPCDSDTAFAFDVPTGRITLRSNGQDVCLTAVQRQQTDVVAPVLTVSACVDTPADSQQFQLNPATGALRQKGSHCIAQISGTTLNYRDCCIARCA